MGIKLVGHLAGSVSLASHRCRGRLLGTELGGKGCDTAVVCLALGEAILAVCQPAEREGANMKKSANKRASVTLRGVGFESN
jgi:hypothetical protein